jgi:hypothetical protein
VPLQAQPSDTYDGWMVGPFSHRRPVKECLCDLWILRRVERSFSKNLEATADRPESENVSLECRSSDTLAIRETGFIYHKSPSFPE